MRTKQNVAGQRIGKEVARWGQGAVVGEYELMNCTRPCRITPDSSELQKLNHQSDFSLAAEYSSEINYLGIEPSSLN